MSRDTIQRYQIADYLGCTNGVDESIEFMGVGFNTLNESPSAQTDTGKVYICDKSASSTIKSYQTQFPFDTDLIKNEKTVMELYDIGRNHRTGGDAERDYYRVELFEPITGQANTYKARKFRVAVEVSSVEGEGGNTVRVTGNLNGIGDFVDGTFNTATRTFIPAYGAEYLVTFSVGISSTQIPDAVININDKMIVTDETGIARVKLPSGTYTANITADGYVDKTENISVTDKAVYSKITMSRDTGA